MSGTYVMAVMVNWREKGRIHLRELPCLPPRCSVPVRSTAAYLRSTAAYLSRSRDTSVTLAAPAFAAASMASHANAPLPITTTSCEWRLLSCLTARCEVDRAASQVRARAAPCPADCCSQLASHARLPCLPVCRNRGTLPGWA